MSDDFSLLCEKLGIAQKFYDAAQNHKEYIVDDSILLKMINYLGFPLKNKEQSSILLEKIENKRWQYALEPIYVVRQNAVKFDVIVPANKTDLLEISISCENKEFEAQYTQKIVTEKQCGRTIYQKLEIEIMNKLAPQYYTVQVACGEQTYQTTLNHDLHLYHQ